MENKRILLIDLDNTLSDAAWREHLAGVEDWETYHGDAAKDEAINDMRDLVSQYPGSVIVMSERPEKWRQLTVKWLAEKSIWPDEVLLRPASNKMKVTELKVWFAETVLIDKTPIKNRLALVIDDNEKVIDAFNAIGIPGLHYRGRINRAQA